MWGGMRLAHGFRAWFAEQLQAGCGVIKARDEPAREFMFGRQSGAFSTLPIAFLGSLDRGHCGSDFGRARADCAQSETDVRPIRSRAEAM
jgi:hypothetical protein